ncbi:bifunctional apoptosis regulator [Solea senegalensis]|uniref:Bifunctional apoptosis regulator n=1 Tax=Solea senegalensis TaxID=28829 RepID=A0AAV6Q5R0_SOLSE|nr:bifunctional apoptosis regulator [Solea senegalensis]
MCDLDSHPTVVVYNLLVVSLFLFFSIILQQMEWESSDDRQGGSLCDPLDLTNSSEPPTTSNITEHEFSCHCCYDILVNPTTLTCGHNFCRHCLALWWESSRKNECPECREKWEGFPKVNILLRYGDNLGRSRTNQHKGAGFFFSGVLSALTFVAVMVMVYHWSSGVVEQHDLLITKPVSHWTAEEVVSWLENLGPWAQLYSEAFQQENVNGRLLLMLGEEELLKLPYNIESHAHRRAVLAELDRVKVLGVKPPQNLWEYKAANAGKSLFLLYALKRSPRLTLFYLYLFDYAETFLPFLHTCCPAIAHLDHSVESSFLNSQLEPNWRQWVEFLVKYLLLPYQLIAEFAWDWLDVHYWTSRFIIVNAMLLSVLEGCTLWRLLTRARIRALPDKMWNHLWKMLSQGFAFALLWPFVPQFVCNCFFYWALYFSPIVNIDMVVQQLMHPETQAP